MGFVVGFWHFGKSLAGQWRDGGKWVCGGGCVIGMAAVLSELRCCVFFETG